MPTRPHPHFAGLQILRGLAAIGVVLLHVSGFVGAPVHAGAFGVDLFFVISGFLMVAITGKDSRPLPFLKDRFLRIAPLYWLATAVMVIWWTFISRSGPPQGAHLIASLFFIPFRPSPDGSIFPVLTLGWTLNYEVMFYLLFATTLILPVRARLPALFAVFVLLVSLGLIFRPAAAPLAFWTHPVILEFLAGACLARFWKGGRSRKGGVALIGSGVLVYCAATTTVRLFGLDPLAATQAPLAVPAVMIVAGTLLLEPRAASPSSATKRVFVALGNASYSIYIWQFSIIYVALAIAATVGMGPAARFTFMMTLCVGGGVILFHLVEKPIIAWFRRQDSRYGNGILMGRSRGSGSAM